MKSFTEEELERIKKRSGGANFGISAMGRIGESAHEIIIHNHETGEKQFLMKKGIKIEFAGFKKTKEEVIAEIVNKEEKEV